MNERPSIASVQQSIIAEFDELGNGLARYTHLVELAKTHTPSAQLHREDHLIPGCQSKAWFSCDRRNGALEFEADSDSMLIQGIIVLLLRIFNKRTALEIAEAEIFILKHPGLFGSLSPTKSNGLQAILNQFTRAGQDQIG